MVLHIPTYGLSLHDALPICGISQWRRLGRAGEYARLVGARFRAPTNAIGRVGCPYWAPGRFASAPYGSTRSEEHTSALQSRLDYRCGPRPRDFTDGPPHTIW